MMLKNKKIAIVGGGPGGLTLARLLQLKNLNVKVYERDENRNVRVQGATLDLHEESGLKALEEAGLLEAFYQNYRPDAGKLRILDEEGVIHLDDHDEVHAIAETRPEIDRQQLRDILLDSLVQENIIWDSHFTRMEACGDGWNLFFNNGTSDYADIVIAADGARSKIRAYITDIKPIYSGVTIVEGNIYNAEKNAPKLWDVTKGGKVFAFGHQQSIILSAKGEGTPSFYTGCKVEENWTQNCSIDFKEKNQILEWFKSAFKLWDKSWEELFASDNMWALPRPMYHYPLDQTWQTLPNLTMIGDAAHKMPPYAGEGVNMAMLDAYELAKCLTNPAFKNTQEAIQSFEREMQTRASEITRFTLENTELLHSDGAIKKMLTIMQVNPE